MARTFPVTIAGKKYELLYTTKEKREIYKRTGKKLIDAMIEGDIEEHAAIVCAGLRHADRKISIDKVIDLFDAHIEADGHYQDILQIAYLAIVRSRLLGEVHEEVLFRALNDALGVVPIDEQDSEPGSAEGKDPMTQG